MNKHKKLGQNNNALDGGPAIFSEPVAFNHTVSLSRLLTDPEEFDGVVHLLQQAGDNDTITFLLNNHGGNVDVLLPLINFLEITSAHTVALCTGSQSSAATIFAMYCDDLVALDHSSFMIHEMQTGHLGTMSNVVRDTQHTEKRNRRLVQEAYGGFLTPQEIEDVLRGVELYLDDDAVNARFPLRQEWREQFYAVKQEAFQKKMQEAQEAFIKAQQTNEQGKPVAKKASSAAKKASTKGAK
jgi:ATP-dependent protease ClpP protease subunit